MTHRHQDRRRWRVHYEIGLMASSLVVYATDHDAAEREAKAELARLGYQRASVWHVEEQDELERGR